MKKTLIIILAIVIVGLGFTESSSATTKVGEWAGTPVTCEKGPKKKITMQIHYANRKVKRGDRTVLMTKVIGIDTTTKNLGKIGSMGVSMFSTNPKKPLPNYTQIFGWAHGKTNTTETTQWFSAKEAENKGDLSYSMRIVMESGESCFLVLPAPLAR